MLVLQKYHIHYCQSVSASYMYVSPHNMLDHFIFVYYSNHENHGFSTI